MKKKLTCFLIDDDTDDQKIDSLASCVFANDGIYALEKINTDTAFIPHLILIDVNMPRMNGVQCLVEIRKINRLQKVPVYMYSTAIDSDIVQECKKLGADDFMVKSPSIIEIENALSEILSQIKKGSV
jgi:CheY-like chemotaxis protein